MLLLFSFFVLILNMSLYSIVKEKNIKRQLLIIFILVIIIICVIKGYNSFIFESNMPSGLSVFVLLFFSLGILILNLIKSVILKSSSVIGENIVSKKIYLKIIFISITIFQVYMIVSGVIYHIKD
jgi:hypothetical protein